MAYGEVVSGLSSVVAGSTFDIRPGSGTEWVIHNIYYDNGTVEFYITDGANLLKFDEDTVSGGRLGASFHCTNNQWIQMKNTSTVTILFGYDGIQTK